jgi:uncharacterized protein YpuA (DUF1002 family)
MGNATVTTTIELPSELLDRAVDTARREKRPLEALLPDLIQAGLDSHDDIRQIWERVSASYRQRVGEAELNKPADQVLEELRDLRDRMAHALYP